MWNGTSVIGPTSSVAAATWADFLNLRIIAVAVGRVRLS